MSEATDVLAAHVREVQQRTRSAVSLAKYVLEVVEQDTTGAFSFVNPRLLQDAQDLDAAGAHGLELFGTPVGVKDLVDVRGMPTSFGSSAYSPRTVVADSSVIERLRAAGALIVGKTKTSPLAASTVTPDCRNPLNPRWISGGSSGGSAAAVGIGAVTIGVGTDTAGSIRIPAAICGLVGYKPTVGAIDSRGVLAASTTFDTVGPICADVAEAAKAFAIMRSSAPQVPEEHAIPRDTVTLGLVKGDLFELADAETRSNFQAALHMLQGAPGVKIVEFEIPYPSFFGPSLIAIDTAEIAELHHTILSTNPEALEVEAREFLSVGLQVAATTYIRARAVRAELQSSMDSAMHDAGVDALLAPGLGAKPLDWSDLGLTWVTSSGWNEPISMSYSRVCWLASLTGQPAVTLPVSTANNVPFSLQLIGVHGGDDALLDVARQIERLTDSASPPG